MRQRNTSGYQLLLPTLTPPRVIDQGEELDYPELLAGCTPVDGPGSDQPGTGATPGTGQQAATQTAKSAKM